MAAAMTTEAPADELLTLREVAALMRITEVQAKAIVRDTSNPLREVRVGRYIRVTRSSYDAFVKGLAS